MTDCRWIVVSGSANPETAILGFDVAADLSLRAHVLFWDVANQVLRCGKSADELAHFGKASSSRLLRNYLSYQETGMGILQAAPPQEPVRRAEIFSLLKQTYSYVLVAAPADWQDAYLHCLDMANLILLTCTAGESEAFLERLAAYKFPRSLVHSIAITEKIRALSSRLETQTSLYVEAREISAAAALEAKTRLHQQLLEASSGKPANTEAETTAKLEQLLAADTALPASRGAREQVFTDLLQDVLGLGPIEPLLKDPSISEIMVIGSNSVFVEKHGRLHHTDVRFDDAAQLRTVIDRIVAPLGRRVDESMPICDARLSDGSRVNIVIPPLALDGPTLTIRKFMEQRLALEDLIRFGTLNDEMGAYLTHSVRSRRNLIISGGTGSGKTTLLNILSGLIAPDERIVTIEDAAELRLQQPHVVRMESRPANAEGQGAIPIRRLVINALRMRPDRIVVGECRGGEALDMLQAMNTGHDGSLTTLHANSPRDALGRLEALVLLAGIDLPIRVVREQIRSAVHVIVQIARQADGSRRITSITELNGMEGDVLTTTELFRYRAGRFESTGLASRWQDSDKDAGG